MVVANNNWKLNVDVAIPIQALRMVGRCRLLTHSLWRSKRFALSICHIVVAALFTMFVVGHLQFRSSARKVRVVMAYQGPRYVHVYRWPTRNRTSANKFKGTESRLTREAKRPFSFFFWLYGTAFISDLKSLQYSTRSLFAVVFIIVIFLASFLNTRWLRLPHQPKCGPQRILPEFARKQIIQEKALSLIVCTKLQLFHREPGR